MDEDLESINEENGEVNEETNNGSTFWGIIIGIIVASFIWGIGKNGKYEGQTAEEWFNDYDEEESIHAQLKECLNDLPTGNFRDIDGYSLQSDIQNCVDQY